MARPVGPPPRNETRATTPRPATSVSTQPSSGGGASDPTLAVFAKFLEAQGYEVHKRADGRSLQDFFRCVKETTEYSLSDRRYQSYEAKKRLDHVYGTEWTAVETRKAAMGEEVGGQRGGYLVPVEWSLQIIDAISEESFIYPRATVVPMDSKTLQLPRVNVETAQAAGTSPFFGGIHFSWTPAASLTETEPTYSQLELEAWDLVGYAALSNQFLADTGPAGEAALVRLLGKAAAWQVEYAFVQGLGSAGLMPLGIVNAPGTVGVSRNTPAHVKIQDVATMASKLIPYAWRRAIWAVSPSTWADIAQIATFYLNEYPGDEGQIGYLLSRPVFTSEKCSILGTAGDVLLFDPSLYIVGNRQEVLVDVSEHALFQNNQTVMRVWIRADGKPYNAKAITLADGSSTASPFVCLV